MDKFWSETLRNFKVVSRSLLFKPKLLSKDFCGGLGQRALILPSFNISLFVASSDFRDLKKFIAFLYTTDSK